VSRGKRVLTGLTRATWSYVAAGLAVLLVAGLLTQAAPAAASAVRPPVPVPQGARSVTALKPVPYRPARTASDTGRKFIATSTRWPEASTTDVALAAPTGRAPAGAMSAVTGAPAWVQAVRPHSGTWRGPSRVRLAVQSQAVSRELGIHGVVLQVSGLDAGSGTIRAGLDYRSFAQAYGGNYGLRLMLAELPACALTTPQLARCRKQTPLASDNSWKTSTVSAVAAMSPTPQPQAAGTSATAPAQDSTVVLAATTTAGEEGGAAGTYGVTSLKPAGSWAEGGSSGSFTYTYPISLPGASSTLVPSSDLDYDSGNVDGQTAATQAQADWAGDGWSTNDSFIEQSFTPCDDTPEGVTLPSADQTDDMCYNGNVATLSLGGETSQLVYDSSTSTWRLEDDDGSVVTAYTSANGSNVTGGTTYWEIQERDGTTYWFGRNELPGWASGDATTDSVDTEPVYCSDSGDPCTSTTTASEFDSSVSTMAYRWHLDYVTDAHGDAMSYWYHQDSNFYGEDNGAKDVTYVRDSYLLNIDYGFRAGDAYVTADIPDKVVYGTTVRCFASTCPAISSSNSGTAPGAVYPDVPYDLNCASGATCSIYGPTYWSTVRLDSITTEQYSAADNAYEPVDTYALTETEPATGDGTSPTLWLSSIQRTGDDTSAGGSTAAIKLPAVEFGMVDLQNRVDTTNYPGLYRYRIASVTGELGSVTAVSYGLPDPCTDAYVDSITTNAGAASNTESCYPVWWTPNSTMVMDWFEKYAVTEVTVDDTTGGALLDTTDYSYAGGAAWHYDDNPAVKAKYRTYGQFRGYGSVTTYTGDGSDDPQTEQVTSYYRGMSDDDDSTAVTLTDSQGGTHDDTDQLAGEPLETTVYNGSGGPVDHSTIYSYWVSAATATESLPGLPDLTANMVQPAETWTRQALTDGGTTAWRYTETDDTYDTGISDADFGLLEYSYTHTVPVNAAYDQCTTTTYAPVNTTENLAGLVASQETDSVACSGFTEASVSSVPDGLNTLGAPTDVSRPADVVSATETFYDDPSFSTTFPQTTAPTTGDVTMTRKAVSYASGAFTWQTESEDTYDEYGRVEDAYDGNGNETSTAYSVTADGLTTAESVTDALGQSTSQTLDPTRGLMLTSTDANGVVTTKEYDALGRLTSEWDYSRPTTDEANEIYTYTAVDTGVSGVTEQTMGDAGGYATTVTIVDSLGRTRQTQSTTPQGGRLITDTEYDSRGWVWKKNNRYWDSTTAPEMDLVSVADNEVPDQDEYVFNGLGEVVQDINRDDAETVSTTTTVYNGDSTTVIPPSGGTIKTTVTDPLGRTSEIEEYTSAPTLVTPSNTFTGIWYVTGGTTTDTAYGYDGNGDQSSMTDPGGDQWTWAYNLLGQVISETDPDTGTTTMTYDGDGNLLSSSDADGNTVSFTYDQLDRKTAEYAATTADQSASNELYSWVYDNSNKVSGVTDAVGQVTTETSYSGGNAFVIQQKGFNQFGESLGETVTIPSTLPADAQDLAGTYTFSHTYTTNTGEPFTDTYPDAGGLPAETVEHTYLASPLELPSGLGGSIDGYAQDTTYDAYGDVIQEEIGTSTNLAAITNTYDPDTLKLTDSLVTRTVDTPADVDEESYTYDPYGNITSQTDTRDGESAESETQCFTYNGLDQLTAAWTATDACAATPSSTSDSTVGDGLGTSSEYWTTYTYDDLGDLTSTTDHDSVTGGTDTTTTNTYDGSSTGQPHTLTTSAETGGTTATSTFSYYANGDMKTRDTAATGDQTLTWNAAGQLAQVSSTTEGTTSYVYDPDGDLLLQEDPSSWTLYLPGEQLTLNLSGSSPTVSGVRIIPLPSGGDVVRTGTTTSYYFEIPDIRGTSTLYLDNTAQTPTWRQFTPYGAPRGTGTTWIDNRGYLGQPDDPVTGLTELGARYYDPSTGQFVSPDPVLDTGNPQDFDPYAYAQDNPVTFADPDGQCAAAPGRLCVGSTAPVQPAPSGTSGGSSSSGSGSGSGSSSSSGSGSSQGTTIRQAEDPATCGRTGVGCQIITVTQPYVPGGNLSWLAGAGDSIVSLLDGPVCYFATASGCADSITHGRLPSQVYTGLVSDAGLDTASNSTYGNGRLLGNILIAAVSLTAGGEGVGVDAEGDAMAAVRQTGMEGENLAGISQSAKVRIPSATGTAAYRIPDELTDSTLTEVKNVQSLSYTSQLQDFYRYSVANGLNFQLVVRAGTTLSTPLESLTYSPGVNLMRLLP
jgi:RHS repeat-associated protein